MTPNDILLCLVIIALLSHHQRSFLLQQMGTNTEIHSWTHAESETVEHGVLNGMSSSNPSPRGSRDFTEEAERLSEPAGMDDSKEAVSTRPSRAAARMSSMTLWQHAQGAHGFPPDRIPARRGGSGRGLPSLTMKLSSTDNLLQTESQFSPVESH